MFMSFEFTGHTENGPKQIFTCLQMALATHVIEEVFLEERKNCEFRNFYGISLFNVYALFWYADKLIISTLQQKHQRNKEMNTCIQANLKVYAEKKEVYS